MTIRERDAAKEPLRRDGRRRLWPRALLAIAAVYLLPVAVAAGLWLAEGKPMSWRSADWSSAGLLAPASAGGPAEIRVYAARTGRWKGIVAVHSWIVLKPSGDRPYERYEVVGWGSPVRRDARPPDGRWYSNEPQLLGMVAGAAAGPLVARVKRVIAAYPYSAQGSYRIWPGPNSNSFVAWVLDRVPEIGVALPPTAIGKDYPVDGAIAALTGGGTGLRLSLSGVVSLTAGLREGIELNLFGLVAGIDLLNPAIKLPGIGRIGVPAGDWIPFTLSAAPPRSAQAA
ncbi:MAG: DUF3750 domain-containing protein [Flavobacteriaceae bacterium]